ncbi:MAG: glycosyltransferase [Verrucomicrobiota bacterium]|jgi:glycosyltransferase involved in cell wall biosynthesis
MKISVLIPAYNAAATIKATLDSVLSQTAQPSEILLFEDGSTDETSVVLEAYKPRVRVFQNANHGVAYARNFLCQQAQGDVLAFLDADDVWHPAYLEAQEKMIQEYPDAVAWFTEHENIVGLGDFEWPKGAGSQPSNGELIQPAIFVTRYNETPLSFQMSCCCVRKSVMSQLGPEPFRVTIADDTFFHNSLPLLGPVAHTTARLAAYRIGESTLSSNRLRMSVLVVDVFKILDEIYKAKASPDLYHAFRAVHASRRRNCGKYLMWAAKTQDARQQFKAAIRLCKRPDSAVKSVGLYFCTLLPRALQPRWPEGERLLQNFIHQNPKNEKQRF